MVEVLLLVFCGERDKKKTDLHFNSVYKLAKMNAAVSYIWQIFIFLKSKRVELKISAIRPHIKSFRGW